MKKEGGGGREPGRGKVFPTSSLFRFFREFHLITVFFSSLRLDGFEKLGNYRAYVPRNINLEDGGGGKKRGNFAWKLYYSGGDGGDGGGGKFPLKLWQSISLFFWCVGASLFCCRCGKRGAICMREVGRSPSLPFL